jgi:hypothetical protein
MFFVAAAHVMRLHDLSIVLPAKDAELYVQLEPKPSKWRQFLVVFIGEDFGYLLTGEHQLYII